MYTSCVLKLRITFLISRVLVKHRLFILYNLFPNSFYPRLKKKKKETRDKERSERDGRAIFEIHRMHRAENVLQLAPVSRSRPVTMFYLRDRKYRRNPSEGRNAAKSQLRLGVVH